MSATADVTTRRTHTWVPVCTLADLEVERGRAALIGDAQIALFLLPDGAVRAVSNYDPYGDANVLSRGIVGTRTLVDGSEAPTISSPLHKQSWDLRTGTVLETHGKEPRGIAVFPIGVDGDRVLIRWEEQS